MIIALITLNSSCKKDSSCDYAPNGKINIYNPGANPFEGFIDGVSVGSIHHDPVDSEGNNNYFIVSPGTHSVKCKSTNSAVEINNTVNVEQCKITKINL